MTRGSRILSPDLGTIPMLPGLTVLQYLRRCEARDPRLFELLHTTRVPLAHIERVYSRIAELSTHFESKLENGRGDSYRRAQSDNYMLRSVGFMSIFDLAVPPHLPSSGWCVLDALGGNGTMTKILRESRREEHLPFIVTNDVSGRMIESALAAGLPAIRQPLQDLVWFDDATFDAVLVAYGTHHIVPADRPRALQEAFRVVKPGGTVVVQDFEIGCPTTLWYSDVLDRYTTAGHKFVYFTRDEMRGLLDDTGFVNTEVMDVYDPFILFDDDKLRARDRMMDYLFTLFALERISPDDPDERVRAAVEELVHQTATFMPDQVPENGVASFSVRPEAGRWRVEVPRLCLVATGRRPAAAQ